MVVEVLVFGEGSAGCGDGEFAGVEVPELDAGAVVGSFDAAIELRSSGRQDKLRDVELLASLLELGPELGAAVDLDGMEGEGQVLDHGLQETLGVTGGGAGIDTCHHVLADRGDGPELLEMRAVEGYRQVIDLDELAGLGGPGAVAPSLGVARWKERRFFSLTRPRQKAQGRIRPKRTPWARMRPTVDSLR